MARHVLSATELTHPTDPNQEAAPAAQVERVVFVKNRHPKEKFKLPDGTPFQFPTTAYATTDPKMIEALRAIADKHGIVEK